MQLTASCLDPSHTYHSVIPPENIQKEWVGSPSDHWAARYKEYYLNRKLKPESEGWSIFFARHTIKKAINVVQTSATWMYQGVIGQAVKNLVTTDIVYNAGSSVVSTGHAVYTANTRVPIDHHRVDAVVAKLRLIQKCHNAQLFIDRVQAVYKRGYLSSKGSHTLSTILSSTMDTTNKIQNIINFLTLHSTLEGYLDVYYHNGKTFYQDIAITVEHSKIDCQKPGENTLNVNENGATNGTKGDTPDIMTLLTDEKPLYKPWGCLC